MAFPANPTIGQQHTEGSRLYQWSSYSTWDLVANVAGHAAAHATGGADAITPASIGAAATSHTHTASQVSDFAAEAAKYGPVVSVAGRTGAIAISSADVSGLGSLATASSVAYSALTGTPSSFTPSSHASSHATGGSDAITASSIGAAAASHTHNASAISDFATEAAKYGPVTSVAGRTGAVTISSSDVSGLGTLATASSVAYSSLTGTPSSFSPSSHASSHATGGSDVITPASIGAAAASHAHSASDITSGTLNAARLPASAVVTTDGRLTKSLARFTARDNHPPATNFATLDTRNSVLVLEFDAATEESATFIGVVNENASLTSGLTVRIWWMGDTATSGNVQWGVQFEDTGTDLDADSYDTNAQVTSAANATSGVESIASITITTIDSLAAGDRFRLRVYRVAADATNDTMTGDAQLVAVEVRAA